MKIFLETDRNSVRIVKHDNHVMLGLSSAVLKQEYEYLTSISSHLRKRNCSCGYPAYHAIGVSTRVKKHHIIWGSRIATNWLSLSLFWFLHQVWHPRCLSQQQKLELIV
ncbi:hypothetical protein FRX31_026898 [Thalictrum thalictroides]|uniref:Uncharacterized protein n=1 Tax=Thalictrum thalictroides TaxID=46969 RepID=A0A7J6VH34_THATH|nr:hypothetical protein FRX31_026898 [Thalictrum thalictroides]